MSRARLRVDHRPRLVEQLRQLRLAEARVRLVRREERREDGVGVERRDAPAEEEERRADLGPELADVAAPLADRQVDLDADLCELPHDRLGELLVLRVAPLRGLHPGGHPVPEAGLREQRLRLRRVVRVGLHLLAVPELLGREERRERLAVPLVRVLEERRLVDGVVQRPPDPHVLERPVDPCIEDSRSRRARRSTRGRRRSSRNRRR